MLTVTRLCSAVHLIGVALLVASVLAGAGAAVAADGPAGSASFHNPFGVAAAAAGAVYVADVKNHRIRRITPQGDVVTIAGPGVPGPADGVGGIVPTPSRA